MILPAQYLLFLRSIQDLTLQEAGGGAEIAFLVHFSDPIDPKKFDFSQIAMTMSPILFRGIKMV